MNQYAKLILLVGIGIVASISSALADGTPEFLEDSGNGSLLSSPDQAVSQMNKVPSLEMPEEDLLAYQYCGRDSDCVAVVNGCCQCNQGGKMVAIAKNRLESFKSKFACENVLCAPDELNYQCSDGVVSCIKNRCNYFDALE